MLIPVVVFNPLSSFLVHGRHMFGPSSLLRAIFRNCQWWRIRGLTLSLGEERSLPPLKKRRLLTGRASASFDNDEYHDEEVDAKLVLHLPGMAVGGEHTTATNTPQSTSPRSEHTSHDEAAKAAGNDLDMLVVAALESDVKSDPRSQMSFVTQPSMQSMTTYSFPPYMTESPQFFYAFWIFERQPMVPVCLPTMSVGRDVVHAIRTQLVCAGLIHAETRPHVFVRLANQQVFALEENSLHHVATLGLLNPTTLLEVTCQSH